MKTLIIRDSREVPDFGARLRSARDKSGKTPQQLATQAGISTAYWYKLEGEKVGWVSAEIVEAIKAVVGDFLEGHRND